MSYTLDVWYYTDTHDADEPVSVRSESDLERVLRELVEHEQPHPTQVSAPELPTRGLAEVPDRMFKIGVAQGGEVGAMLYFGPTADGVEGIWMTRADEPAGDVPTLYRDVDSRREFPADAALPLSLVGKALREFQSTGVRPDCVQWQEADAF
ncbi:Immunity protein Imm1 [Lentzea albidocapillata subsp. violacea]|uniref:Immunity protein Imm1 n=1 Tax=Lentzea albidocapillata subsp. violacea TaxID=128104 RepID=A0A1G9RCA7_9PSEU|nr:Imm1 family immunity protein [Lentzea albidocapillata]SDM20055.1 Immunity protein Imm1 [Lentzea albidocapillata subsp. violacea]